MTIVYLGAADYLPLGGSHDEDNNYHYVRTHPVGKLEYRYDETWITPFKTREETPIKWRTRLCYDNYVREWEGNPFLQRCGDCHKWHYKSLHRCVYCGIIFIRDFFHPRFCYFFPTCWDCTPYLPWECCPRHTPGFYRAYRPELLIIEPLGANEFNEISDEALAKFGGPLPEFKL